MKGKMMARENRKENRAMAKAENAPRPGEELDDLLEDEYEDEDQPDLFGNASESENGEDDASTVTPEVVDKEGEEDSGEEEVLAESAEEGEPEAGEVAESEKPAEEEPETEEEEVTEPTP